MKINLLSKLTLVVFFFPTIYCYVGESKIKNYKVFLGDKSLNPDYKLLTGLSAEDFIIKETEEELALISEDTSKDQIVRLRFEDGLFVDGWGKLDLSTNSDFVDGIQAFAAGLLEGYSTAEHIVSIATNMAESTFKDLEGSSFSNEIHMFTMPADVLSFFADQEHWAEDKVKAVVYNNNENLNNENYDFWFHVGLILEQFDGIFKGTNVRLKELGIHPLPRWVFYMLNGVGDLLDIIPAVRQDIASYNYKSMDIDDVLYYHGIRSSCSALIKVLPGNEDLMFGHSSWFDFSLMNRIFKHYDLNFNNKGTKAYGISFSSYPGFLESLDDFYMLSSGLSWTQTSNAVLDKTVYTNVKSSSLLAWQRVRVASAISESGEEFYKNMKTHFSGTYANQYMILDFNLFSPGKPLKNNTLWVIEEMPGLMIGKDMTEALRFGYWPSFNVPFFKQIWKKSGYEFMTQKHGTQAKDLFHELAPRSEIFKRDSGNVNSILQLKKILRSNNYKNDIYSGNDSSKALCSRYDLLKANSKRKPYGCYDTKVSSFNYGAKDRKASIINGPTSAYSFAATYIKPFSWVQDTKNTHMGLPDVFNFSFVDTKPYY